MYRTNNGCIVQHLICDTSQRELTGRIVTQSIVTREPPRNEVLNLPMPTSFLPLSKLKELSACALAWLVSDEAHTNTSFNFRVSLESAN
jgi:hypothetical protein